MTNEEIVLSNLKTLMKSKQMSMRALANECGISSGQMHRILNGTAKLSFPELIKMAEALEVDLKNDVLKNITTYQPNPNEKEKISVAIMSISNSRVASIVSPKGKILGSSLLSGGLDLADDSDELMKLINESANDALLNIKNKKNYTLANARLKLVTQSYEFEDKRKQFKDYAYKHFHEIVLLPDWIVTLLAAFDGNEGISLVTDKGVSLSYLHNGQLKKIGGWKYPVYDLGGENWLGVETIKHTIEAAEGYIPMTELARQVLSKFNGKIERITERCIQSGDPDIYCLFTSFLLTAYFTEDDAAKNIIASGFKQIERTIKLADKLIGKKLKITLNGSLAKVYKPFIEQSRLIEQIDDMKKVELLARINEDDLQALGIIIG